MNKFYLNLFFLCGVFLLSLSGCYEGWDEMAERGEQNEENEPEKDDPIFAYILFEAFRLSDSGIDDPTCFANTGTEEYRKTENSMRLDSLVAEARSRTEIFVQNIHEIGVDDCDTLAEVEEAAIDSAPWGSESSPLDATSDLKSIHLKVVVWDGDVARSPSLRVKGEDWTAFSNLIDAGVYAESYHYFVLSNNTSGFFDEWRDAISSSAQLEGTIIDTVDPSPSGINARESTIDSDAEDFGEWLDSISYLFRLQG